MTTLRHAFKEWAVICTALATGRQVLILRKGGIAEDAGTFRVEHDRFWLYPTWVHQQSEGITAGALPLWEQTQASRPPQGRLRLSHFAEVVRIHEVRELVQVERLAGRHCWSVEAVRTKFLYRRPGFWVLAVRVWRMAQPHDILEREAYAGCRSWVELEEGLSTECAAPVLSDEAFARDLAALEGLLRC
jgi:hypothetical protein